MNSGHPATLPCLLLTGCTGTFGRAFLDSCLDSYTIRGLSRDELKQSEIEPHPNLRLLLGDVRDKDRLRRAMEGCQIVIHAAALKQVPAGELHPDEFVKTNVLGTLNVIEACHDVGVEKAVLLSSDKAVAPANLYGATKLCAEKMFLAANNIPPTRFSVVRYGNVKGSRGSLLSKKGPVTLTDARATRFWMEPQEAVDLVLLALREMQGGEVFVPKIRAQKVVDMIDPLVLEPAFPKLRAAMGESEESIYAVETGLRPGEKLHESLISQEEVGRTYDCGDHYRVCAEQPYTADGGINWEANIPGQPVPPDFSYTSESCA